MRKNCTSILSHVMNTSSPAWQQEVQGKTKISEVGKAEGCLVEYIKAFDYINQKNRVLWPIIVITYLSETRIKLITTFVCVISQSYEITFHNAGKKWHAAGRRSIPLGPGML